MHCSKEEFHREARPTVDCLARLRNDLGLGDGALFSEPKVLDEPIFMSFGCDPYPPAEVPLRLTRQCIESILESGNAVRILTKSALAERDFDLLQQNPKNEFGMTLTLANYDDSKLWEPHASSLGDRMCALLKAHKRGIRTWVSCEPVVFPSQSLAMIESAMRFGIDVIRVGKLNDAERRLEPDFLSLLPRVDWRAFALDVIALHKRVGFGGKLFIKEELRAFLRPGEWEQ